MDAIYRTIASVVMSLMAAMGIQPPPATWQLHVMLDGNTVDLSISDHPHSNHSLSLPIDQFEGLKARLPTSGQARFRLKRDAGTFEFDGVLRNGAGGGTMEFMPSESFQIELAKRGFAKPSPVEQMKMAWHDTGFGFIDELAAKKYQRPTLEQLVNAGDHGIDRTYVRELSDLGYRIGAVETLIRLHDHGIDGRYIRDLRALGYRLTVDELVAAHDHGVTPAYAKPRAPAPIEQLISLHDHGH